MEEAKKVIFKDKRRQRSWWCLRGHKNRETENRTEAETELTEISVFSINRYFSVSIYTNRIKFGRIRFLAPPTEQDRIDRIE
jgi:hypothetical protein